MSLFSPVDVRGPDQRRKRLLERLMGQQGGAGGASRVPMPPHVGMGEGRPFSGSSASPRGNFTHAPNVLASLMARLGVGGQGQAGEMSAGPGMAIPRAAPYASGAGGPGQGQGQGPPVPMPVPGAPINAPSPSPPPPPAGGGISPGMAPVGSYTGVAPGTSDPQQAVNFAAEGSAAVGNTSGLVPLGNGMFYDPVTNQVVGGGGGAGMGAGARMLGT